MDGSDASDPPGPPGGDPPGAAAGDPPAWTRVLHRAPGRLVEPLLKRLDRLYAAFQAALKTYGLVPAGSASPPEDVSVGGREAVLPRREERWPELRLPLPETAVHWFSVASLYRRSAVWRVPADPEGVAGLYRDALAEASGEVAEETSGPPLELPARGDGIEVLVKIARHPGGTTLLSLSQRLARLELEPSSGRVELPPPPERPLPGGEGEGGAGALPGA